PPDCSHSTLQGFGIGAASGGHSDGKQVSAAVAWFTPATDARLRQAFSRSLKRKGKPGFCWRRIIWHDP
ncbi:MAG TPA: hypothetical protein PLP08_04090, partial [Plasticicumulans sp.]|uniref:hypothetical protein n=1 Tax=Plasticicumulans sp. TaxID=2307179 RepID=UPI002B603184